MSLGKRIIFFAILFIIVITACEVMAWAAIRLYFPQYVIARRLLMGDQSQYYTRAQATIGQAYLLYVPAPNYTDNQGIMQHNEDGYRGKWVPLQRSQGKPRILFLGGSTTYGSAIKDPAKTYPAQIRDLLKNQRPEGVEDIEVINAGLTWGTSAELLTHYQFKYRYYRPDLVVIHTGLNDAQANVSGFYHPDYSHWRHQMLNLGPLRPRAKWLMYSHTASLIILNLFYNEIIDGNHFVSYRPPLIQWNGKVRSPKVKQAVIGGPTVPAWYDTVKYDPLAPQKIPDGELAFSNNLRTLVREIQHDGAKILFVLARPNPNPNPHGYFSVEMLEQIYRHEHLMKQMSSEYQFPVAPFPAGVVSKENWVDDCHITGEGASEKAVHILPYIRQILWPE